MPGDENMTFEQALKRLEEIVQALEGQDITLDESVALYKEGALCGNICRQKLENARHELEVWQNGLAESVNLADSAGDDACVPL